MGCNSERFPIARARSPDHRPRSLVISFLPPLASFSDRIVSSSGFPERPPAGRVERASVRLAYPDGTAGSPRQTDASDGGPEAGKALLVGDTRPWSAHPTGQSTKRNVLEHRLPRAQVCRLFPPSRQGFAIGHDELLSPGSRINAQFWLSGLSAEPLALPCHGRRAPAIGTVARYPVSFCQASCETGPVATDGTGPPPD